MSATNPSSVIDGHTRNSNQSHSSLFDEDEGDNSNRLDEMRGNLSDDISACDVSDDETIEDSDDVNDIDQQGAEWLPHYQENESFASNDINDPSSYSLGLDKKKLRNNNISTIIEEEEVTEREILIHDIISGPCETAYGETVNQKNLINKRYEVLCKSLELSEDIGKYGGSSELNDLTNTPLPLDLYSKTQIVEMSSLPSSIYIPPERNVKNNYSHNKSGQNEFLLSGSDKDRWDMLYETRGKEIDNLKNEISNLNRTHKDADSKLKQELKNAKTKLKMGFTSEKQLRELLDTYEDKIRKCDLQLVEKDSMTNKLEISNRSLKSELDSTKSTIYGLEERIKQLKTVECLNKNREMNDKFINKLQNTHSDDLNELTDRYRESLKKATFLENEATNLQSKFDDMKENYTKEINKKDSIMSLKDSKQKAHVSEIIRNINETHDTELSNINHKYEEAVTQNKVIKDQIAELQLINENIRNDFNRDINGKDAQLIHLQKMIENNNDSDAQMVDLNAKITAISANLTELEKQLNIAKKNLSYYEILTKMESEDNSVDLTSFEHSKRKNISSKSAVINHRQNSQELLSVIMENRNLKIERRTLTQQNIDHNKLVDELNSKIEGYEISIFKRTDEIEQLNENILELQQENNARSGSENNCGEVTSTEESSDRMSIEIEKWRDKLQAQIEKNKMLKKSHHENIQNLVSKLKETIDAKNNALNRSFNYKISAYEKEIKNLQDEKKSLIVHYEDVIRHMTDVIIDREGDLNVAQEKYKNDVQVFSDTVSKLSSEQDKIKGDNKQLTLHMECIKKTSRADIKQLREKYKIITSKLKKDIADKNGKVMYYYKIAKKLDGELDESENSYTESKERHTKACLDTIDWLAKSRQSILKSADDISSKISHSPIDSNISKSLMSSVSRVITQVSNLRIQIEH